MSELRIAPNLTLPAEAVTQTFAILAKRGVGKTYLAAVMVEELLKAGLPVVVADPIGVWWGLRASASGNGPGLPIVILGGEHGDVPLEETAGQVIADLIVDERLSAVLDLSLLRKGQQARFMTDFAERLYHRNREPLQLVLDEADAFAPQKPMRGTERLLGAIEDIVRRGRARGLGVTLVTQRAAVLNKDVLTQCEVLVTLRTIAPQDRDAIDAWVKVHGTPEQREEMMSSLPSLPIGHAWFWSPGWLDIFQLAKVRKRETFDSSATPKMGAVKHEPRQLADVDLTALEQRIAATIEKAKSDDPRELRRRIAELERQVKRSGAEKAPERIEVRVEVPVITKEQLDRFSEAVQEIQGAGSKLLNFGNDLVSAIHRVEGEGRRIESQLQRATPQVPTPAKRVESQREPSGGEDPALLKGERKMLEVLAWRHPMSVTRAQLGTLAGYTSSGGTFGKYFSRLKKFGLVKEDAREVLITEDGLAEVGAVADQPQTQEDVLAMWRSALLAGERAMLDELVRIYPESISRDELGERTGYTSTGGTFGKYLGRLRKNGLVEEIGRGVKAADTLFLGVSA